MGNITEAKNKIKRKKLLLKQTRGKIDFRPGSLSVITPALVCCVRPVSKSLLYAIVSVVSEC
jgi:hypothetical protein